MEQLKLKSKPVNILDYHSIDISQYAIPLKADKERYERDFKNFCKRFAAKGDAADIAPEDMVTISCSSENPKFQKEHITIRVGLGLYSKELEEKLVCMPVGETKTFTVGQDFVTVTVEKSMREIIPKLTDEMVSNSGISDIKTVEDACAYCRYKQYDDALEEPADEAGAYLAGKTLEDSTFELDDGELEAASKIVSEAVNVEALSKMLNEDAESSGTPKQDVSAMVEQMARHTLIAAVYAQSMTVLTEEDYEAYLNKLAVANQKPVEEIRKNHPLVEYLINTYNEYFLDTMEAYVFYKLKEIGESMVRE